MFLKKISTHISIMPRGGGLTEPKKLSDDLADICGVEEASRGSCMKYLFAYIKEHGLKDSEDGRFFNPDKKMAKIFGTEKLRSFSMSKHIGKHLSNIEWKDFVYLNHISSYIIIFLIFEIQ